MKQFHTALVTMLSLFIFMLTPLANARYVQNDPINNVDPNGEDTIRVQFKDQKIRIPRQYGNGTIPQALSGGHSGLVLINDQSGYTQYREYGRYPNQGRVPGAVKRRAIPNLVFEDGVPTEKSLKALFTSIVRIGQSNGSDNISLTYRPDSDDFGAMTAEADRWDEEVGYSVTTRKTCHDFCGAVSDAGGSRKGAFKVKLTPDNIDDAVAKTRKRLQRYEERQK